MPTIVDTNVISELLREPPDHLVKAWWFRQLISGDLFTTAITEAELRYGLAIMPSGRRRNGIARRMEYMLGEHFAGRILPFDSAAAQAYAIIYADRRLRGRPTSPSDCQIAAIARVMDAAVATRNVVDFRDSGVAVINPWSTEGTA